MNKYIIGLLIVFFATVANAAPSKLEQIFTADMIDADVSYLEQFSGPARNSDEFMKTKTYKVNGCIVTAHLDSNEKTVQALTLKTSEKCTFDVNAFFKNTNKPIPSANKITFGAFDDSVGGGKFFSDCLTGCGNAYDPSVYELVNGSHADNYIDIMIGVIQSTDAGLDASSKWSDIMKQQEGDEWVISNKFNCTDKYDDVARAAFKNVKIDSISIGHLGEPFNSDCAQ